MKKGLTLAFLAAFAWGSAIVMSKLCLNSMAAGPLFFSQIISATMASWAALLVTRKSFPVNKASLLAYSTGIFEPFLAYTLTLYGLEKVPAGISSVIFSLESVFILILSVIVLKMRVHNPGLFLMLLIGAMAGSLVAMLPDMETKSGSFHGYLLVTAGVFSAAVYVVISARLVTSLDPLTLLTGQLTFSTLLSGIFLFSVGIQFTLPHDTALIVVASGILQYFLAFILWLHAMKWVQVHIAGVMLYFIPVIALILSWVFLAEKITGVQTIGIIITIMSVYFLNSKYENED
ncbi:DMT family transporter [Mangrovibacter phragmitis]|uniref:DMT family transporter n=1 Tax=Mangrovibacter phragmitis TaxID=1691903 RepID=UPI003519B2D1